MSQCLFNECAATALPGLQRCQQHKNRSVCSIPACPNQVYARYLCVRHGGKRVCAIANCPFYARGGRFCGKHGGNVLKRYCLVDGCSKQAHANQKCVRHGGGRFCKADGCSYHSRAGGFCLKHQPAEPATTTEMLDHAILDSILVNDAAPPTTQASATIDPFEMRILEDLLNI
ncbi:hypothetical protein SPRG_04850 [Saprolegnia parasitica CBS 223.65]|uniref:Uncharacterized protein n=1 Tax=Saprolegnia parasitica (strain CBS 223.65) TaxID=695850 RepID=A0A067CGY2_SAPPC|nr:hypothetical protein SPRG_04850 [Saprolegnia parasitica CBS 223.65]KDO29733.1 hypothetical protein SPRG_04850 [Saprolegnia parasitica CBS 223.65]|eukprot:XP_012199382.1 hypothetical protein SPRG_04850 [Saprolegnia parasitica CBS 223.65]